MISTDITRTFNKTPAFSRWGVDTLTMQPHPLSNESLPYGHVMDLGQWAGKKEAMEAAFNMLKDEEEMARGLREFFDKYEDE